MRANASRRTGMRPIWGIWRRPCASKDTTLTGRCLRSKNLRGRSSIESDRPSQTADQPSLRTGVERVPAFRGAAEDVKSRRLLQFVERLGFVSAYRFSDTASPAKLNAPLGAACFPPIVCQQYEANSPPFFSLDKRKQ